MKWKALSLVAVVAGLVLPSGAHACDLYLTNFFHRIPTTLNLGLGVNIQPGDATTLVPSADVGIGLAERVALRGAVGLCHESAEGDGDDFNEVIFGGAAGVKLLTTADGKLTLNGQIGFSTVSYDEDASFTTIPIVAAGEYAASDAMAIFFGAGIAMQKDKFGTFEASDNDPILFGGVNLMVRKCTVSGGIGLKMGDDTDTSISLALKLPLGGG